MRSSCPTAKRAGCASRLRASGPTPPAIELRDAGAGPTRNAVIAELAARRAARRPAARLRRPAELLDTGRRRRRRRAVGADQRRRRDRGRPRRLQRRAGCRASTAPRRSPGPTSQLTQSLRDGYLPLPAVHWRHADFTLDDRSRRRRARRQRRRRWRATRCATPAARPHATRCCSRCGRGRSTRRSSSCRRRAARARSQRWRGTAGALASTATAAAADAPRPTRVRARCRATAASRWRALLAAPRARERSTMPQRHASALLQFRLTLAPGERATVGWVAPLAGRRSRRPTPSTPDECDAAGAAARSTPSLPAGASA